ncbi:CYTH and CHAD domain-containing protein [Streptomyces liangshanensis]|uniref:CYTH and CHAD domain-containing protein n=1 Tax=Streptomyces liangshanensis TaxID=2717324 RepID=UPI0036DE0F8E
MADTKREIERKYELPVRAGGGADARPTLPDLTRVPGVASLFDQGVVELDAVYHDTADLRLAADKLTLRRRTGGADAGWHLKFPVSTGIRDEIQAPLADTVPDELAALLRSRLRGSALIPVVRLRSSREVTHLLDADGALLAEVSVDTVRAERLTGMPGRVAAWAEVEVELADGGDPAILDAVEKKLRKGGLRPAAAPSKLSRALKETAPEGAADGSARHPVPVTAGDHVLAYVRAQADAITAQDPAVRRDLPDAVHQMRVATRRMRSAFRTYRRILDRSVTDPIADELKWLAGELGVDRDHEVLAERITARLDALPGTLVLGPVRARVQIWNAAGSTDSRGATVAVLDGERYLALLRSVDALLADPPLRKGADVPPDQALPKAILKDYGRLAARIEHALALRPGGERDVALHEARKAAKRARYAGEAAKPVLGRPAKRFTDRMKAVQTVLGDHQDSVVAREALRALAVKAHAAGETAFTWGLLYGQEEAQAERRERELPVVWAEASDREGRAALAG